MHVTVDGRRGCEGPPEWTRLRAHRFCLDAIDLADMTLIDGPCSREVDGHVYALAMLAESHVAVHLDTKRSLAYLEMFSCNDFDSEGFVRICINTFNLRDVQDRVLNRGLPARERVT